MTAYTAQGLGRLVRERRRVFGWTQEQLGGRIGGARMGVAALERGTPRVDSGLMRGAFNALGLMDQALEAFLDRSGRNIDEQPKRLPGVPPRCSPASGD